MPSHYSFIITMALAQYRHHGDTAPKELYPIQQSTIDPSPQSSSNYFNYPSISPQTNSLIQYRDPMNQETYEPSTFCREQANRFPTKELINPETSTCVQPTSIYTDSTNQTLAKQNENLLARFNNNFRWYNNTFNHRGKPITNERMTKTLKKIIFRRGLFIKPTFTFYNPSEESSIELSDPEQPDTEQSEQTDDESDDQSEDQTEDDSNKKRVLDRLNNWYTWTSEGFSHTRIVHAPLLR
jgi:hypothetical protein